jgi:hypothetical protein
MRFARGRHIFVIVDALGWDRAQLDRHFPELAERRPLDTVLGYSSAAIPCLLSGRLPSENGHWSTFFRRERGSALKAFAVASRLPSRLQTARVRHPLEQALRWRHGLTGYLNTYAIPFSVLGRMDTCERRSPFLPGGIRRGDSVVDTWQRAALSYEVAAYPATDEEVMKRTLSYVRQGRAVRVLAYLTGWDAVAHAGSADRDEARTLLAKYEAFAADLLSSLGADDRLLIVSDHGMTRVTGTVDVRPALTAARRGIDLYIVDSTMCRLWVKPGVGAHAVAPAFDALDGGHVLTVDERRRWGLDFCPVDSFGDVIFVCDVGTVIAPNHMGDRIPYGMHGYCPDNESTRAVALATYPLGDVGHIADVRKLMTSW